MTSSIFFENRESAFMQRLQSFALVNISNFDVNVFFNKAFDIFENKINILVADQTIIKVYATFTAEFGKKIENSDLFERTTLNIVCAAQIIDIDTIIHEWYVENIVEYVLKMIEEFEIGGSGWTLSSIVELFVKCNKYDGFRGSSYVKLPDYIQNKTAIINIQNRDEQCFNWAVLSALHQANSNAQRVSNYVLYENELNFHGLSFPMEICNVKRFEQLNPTISINVYTYDEENKKIAPARLTKNVKINHIHLLLIQESADNHGDENLDNNDLTTPIKIKNHYCWIKNLSRLISSQVSKTQHRKYICDRCLSYFRYETQLKKHFDMCMTMNKCAITMPEDYEKIIRFRNFKYQIHNPFCLYADFESLLKTPTGDRFGNSENTKAYQEHQPYSAEYYFKSTVPNVKSFYKSHRGPDCATWFAQELYNIYKIVEPFYQTIVPMNLTDIEEMSFQTARKCHICNEYIRDKKVRDHDHLTGKYRGAAHNNCNLNYQDSRIIPCVFHNLSGYDSHFIVRELSLAFEGEISVIPLNDQHYISFTKCVKDSITYLCNSDEPQKLDIKFKFIDSFRFMSSSLDKLASYLPSEDKHILHSEFSYVNDEQIKMLERKGVFPYDFVDSFEKLAQCCRQRVNFIAF